MIQYCSSLHSIQVVNIRYCKLVRDGYHVWEGVCRLSARLGCFM